MSNIDSFGSREFTSPNPLSRYFRIPGFHVKLPTNGVFMSPGSIEFTMTGELPIYPMAAKDELLLKSPDALMNGHALEKLIESCCPGIKKPREVATQDLDVILLAIRAATYGDTMKLEANCPKCEASNEVSCNLPGLLGTMETVDIDNSVRINDEIMVYVRPYSLQNATTLALASYEETRRLQAMEGVDSKVSTLERNREVTKSMERINKLNLDILADCIIKVVVPNAEVTDRRMIQEFIANTPKPWVETIDKKLKNLNGKGIDKSIHITCEKCAHEWDTEVEFNPSNFFDAASSK